MIIRIAKYTAGVLVAAIVIAKLLQFLLPSQYHWMAAVACMGLGFLGVKMQSHPAERVPVAFDSPRTQYEAHGSRFHQYEESWGKRMLFGIAFGVAGLILFMSW